MTDNTTPVVQTPDLTVVEPVKSRFDKVKVLKLSAIALAGTAVGFATHALLTRDSDETGTTVEVLDGVDIVITDEPA